MKSKKGVSDFLTTVLIIGLAVILGTIIVLWGSNFTKTLQKGAESGYEEYVILGAKAEIKRASVNNSMLSLMIESLGEENISRFKVRIEGQTEGDVVETSEGLGAYGIKNFDVQFNSSKVRSVSKIQIIPIILRGGKEVVCILCGYETDKIFIISEIGESVCEDTCSSLGYECDNHTICDSETDCGSCTYPEVCDALGKCTSSCTDTCSSLGYECGTHIICGEATECGSCSPPYLYTCIGGNCLLTVPALPETLDSFATQLYNCILDRLPDEAGKEYWKSSLSSGSTTIENSYRWFFNSDEYEAKSTSNAQYVLQVYMCTVFRIPDQASVEYWESQLNNSLTTRENVLDEFLSSSEFINTIKQELQSLIKIYFGIYTGTESGLPDSVSLSQFEADAGKGASIVGYVAWWYVNFSWGGFNSLHAQWADNMRSHGSIPLIVWQSFNPCRADPCDNSGTPQNGYGNIQITHSDYPDYMKKYSLKRIATGDFDEYIRSWARDIKNIGIPIMLRPMHELNTIVRLSNPQSYPYGESWAANMYDVDGSVINTPQDAVDAWRHIVGIFRQENVDNVAWVWSVLSWPSESYGGNNPVSMSSVYPGDEYVDWIGIECYNIIPGSWQECNSQAITNSYNEAAALSATKPMMMAEMGSIEGSSQNDKANWIENALSSETQNSIQKTYPRIKAVFWWNQGGLSIESSSQANDAFKESISSDTYTSNIYSELAESPVPPPDLLD